MVKGQVEFIVIAGVILIILAVVIYSVQQATTGQQQPGITGIAEEQKLVKDAVTNFIRSGTTDTLNIIYDQGGYMDTSGAFTIGYTDLNLPVWEGCGEVNVPDVTQSIEMGVTQYIMQNLQQEMEFFGKNATFDLSRLKVTASIYKDKINVKVNLPTQVQGYGIEQPYETDAKTNLYDVIDFSQKFADDVNRSRFFEQMTLASMLYSNPDSEYWMPLSGILTECGKPLFKTRAELSPAAQQIVQYTVSHVIFGKTPLTVQDNPFYAINTVGGKAFPGLNVAFIYPENWNLDENFGFSPDPINVLPFPTIYFIPYCMTPYYVSYSMQYPVVVMVEDKQLNKWFTFSVFVNIENNQPGECQLQMGPMSSEYQELLRQSVNPVKITVKDSSNKAVEGATVMFGSLSLGKTDSSGVVENKVPYMLSELRVYKEGYKIHRELLTYDELNTTVTLKKLQENITLHFYGIPMTATGRTGPGAYANYAAGNPVPFSSSFPIQATAVFQPTNSYEVTIMLNNFNGTDFIDTMVYQGLYPSDFNVYLSGVSNSTQLAVGYANSTFTIGETDRNLYVYVPAVEGIAESINETETTKLTQAVINKCGGLVLRQPC
jgi:hypothetical protein